MKYWQNKLICCLCILFTGIFAHGEGLDSDTDAIWAKINQKATQLFEGLNLDFTLDVGVQKSDLSGDKATPYSDLTLSVPLYSSKERQDQQTRKQAYLSNAAELLKQYEQAVLRRQVLADKERLLRVLLKDAGMKEAENYFKVKEDLIETDTKIKELKRKIKGVYL